MLTLLISVALNPAGQVLDRYEAYMRGAKTIAVAVEARFDGIPGAGTGDLSIDREGGNLLFRMTWGPFNYVWSQRGRDILEIEHRDRIYDERLDIPRMIMPASKISRVPEWGFPLPILAGSLRAVFPPEATYTHAGHEDVEGVRTDVVNVKFNLPMVQGDGAAYVDQAGRMLLFRYRTESMEGPMSGEVRFRNYQANTAFRPGFFRLDLPRGYVPRTLPPDRFPLQPGEAIPDLRVQDAQRRTVDLRQALRGNRMLVLVSRGDCAPSQAMAAFLSRLKLPSGVTGATVVSGPGEAAFGTVYRDPDGTALRAFNVPGTPTLFAIDANGVIQRLWFAFDESMERNLEREIMGMLSDE